MMGCVTDRPFMMPTSENTVYIQYDACFSAHGKHGKSILYRLLPWFIEFWVDMMFLGSCKGHERQEQHILSFQPSATTG
jgi:hypothetical protein